ncbi:MAG: Fur family transcriptional regulator [Pseudomonadota bacterium]
MTHRCVQSSLESAERLCRAKGLAFTELRRQVYALIAAEETPVRAYDLLDQLKKQRSNAAPVTVYRALDFLLEAGLVHRVDALHAYTACDAESTDHGGLLLVCNRCNAITEFENHPLEREIARTALNHEFHPADDLIEIRGLCGQCVDGGEPDDDAE